ncbi:hypothetical protein [Flavobacterium sp.]|uniref:hypothetical protein n=1 Tax=Flavobacterium sp. TaxID=239 RepID=UPI002613888F|nr:hypothetical protein [Flavobacterium sp.]
MHKPLLLFLLCFASFHSLSQTFIPLDEETLEFVDDVNYQLYLKKEKVFSGTCNNNNVTIMPEVAFDSVSFSKVSYKTLGLWRGEIEDKVLLTKSYLTLDEVVITSEKKKQFVIGEKNRFIRRQSRSIVKDLDYGIVLANNYGKDLEIQKLVFYVEKVKYKTAYKIRFHQFREDLLGIGRSIADAGPLRYATETLYLNPKQKNAIEVPLERDALVLDGKPVFIVFELLGYYDENDNPVQPANTELTKIKFEISDTANYYCRTVDYETRIPSKGLFNINAMINYDFAHMFFTTPAKNDIVTPAVLLYGSE